MRFVLALIAMAAPAAASAANDVALTSAVRVEHTQSAADGKTVVVLEEPTVVVPGDSLVFDITYRNQAAQAASGFVLTNPIPPEVVFVGSADSAAVVSIDGGRTWGALNTFRVTRPDGTSRPAVPGDVTHIRWSLAQPIASGASGHLSFRGMVK